RILCHLEAANPSELVATLGKDGKLYVINRGNLGQVSDPLIAQRVSSGEIRNAATLYKTPLGTYIAFKDVGSNCPANQSGDLVSVKIMPGSPPTAATAWCASPVQMISPMPTTTDGTNEAIVWSVTIAASRLWGYDGDTGATVFAGGGANDVMGGMHQWNTPIAAKGRFYIAGSNGRLYRFSRN